MAAGWIEKVAGSLEQKKQYRQYVARKRALPEPYRATVEAIERYLTHFGAISSGEALVEMFDDLIGLFEASAADGTPIRDIVGEDPVTFVEDFLENYAEGRWIAKERARLTSAIDQAVQGVAPGAEGEPPQ